MLRHTNSNDIIADKLNLYKCSNKTSVLREKVWVNKEISNDNQDHQGNPSMREYSPAQELINNIPYLAMTMLECS